MENDEIMLPERNREILRAIVHAYIDTAEPVGSRTLSKKTGIGLSPATIRNAMADLEEMGFLTQPHTSAGRLPTEAGLRYFVEHLIEAKKLSIEDQNAIEEALLSRCEDLASTLKKTVELLAAFTGHAAIATAPRGRAGGLMQVRFIRIRPSRILVISVYESGVVQNRIVGMPWDIQENLLGLVAQRINDMLASMDIDTIRETVLRQMEEDRRVIASLLQLTHPPNLHSEPHDVFVSGRPNLLDQPEFFMNHRIRGLFQALEEKQNLVLLLDRCIECENIQVIIAPEELGANVPRCSMVLTPYEGGDSSHGGIGVIGPLRMNYSRVIALVEHTRKVLKEKIQEF